MISLTERDAGTARKKTLRNNATQHRQGFFFFFKKQRFGGVREVCAQSKNPLKGFEHDLVFSPPCLHHIVLVPKI